MKGRPAQVCTAIWDSQGALQNAGEAPAPVTAVTDPSQAQGRRRRHLLAAQPMGGYANVTCDGRVQVRSWALLAAAPGKQLAKACAGAPVVWTPCPAACCSN
jgi:hypothetical protein